MDTSEPLKLINLENPAESLERCVEWVNDLRECGHKELDNIQGVRMCPPIIYLHC